MGYTGQRPSAIPLTSADIVDGTITNDDLAGSISSAKITSLDAAKLTGTVDDARISESSVTQHASDYIAWQSVVTASTFTAVAGRGYPINTTSNACTVTLPVSASVGDTIKFTDYLRTWGTNAVSLNVNSLNFQGYSNKTPKFDTNMQSVTIVYVDATQGWIPTTDDVVTHETKQTYEIDFLVIGGGGGGFQAGSGSGFGGGGGGAGGYRSSWNNEPSGRNSSSEPALEVLPGATALTITIGQGGTGTYRSSNNGGDTVCGSITSAGGGGTTQVDGNTGGSGGGGTDNSNGVGGSGTASQGYDGGDAGQSVTGAAGGGGGAGAEGGTATVTGTGAAGGDGQDSSITTTGASVTRAGGGGGGSGTPGAGGAGGGGAGANSTATAGTVNTGGGGGGTDDSGTGAIGGSGVVILRMADANYSGITTGTPTVDTSTMADETILIFNGDGSYTP